MTSQMEAMETTADDASQSLSLLSREAEKDHEITASAWRVLREESGYSRLLLASLISGIGNWFNTTAILSLLLSLTGSGLAVGVTLALRAFPELLIGPFSGVLADRLPRKTILIVADVVNMGLALVFILATSQGRVWVVYVGTVAMVVVGLFRSPARSAIIPNLVQREHLLAANALEGTVDGSVMIIGAVLGGVVSGAFGPTVAFVVNSLSFLASALLILSVRVPARNQRLSNASEGKSASQRNRGLYGVVDAWREVWPLVQGSRVIVAVLLMAMLWPLGGGMLNTLISVYAFQVYHAGNVGVGVLYGAIGVGIVSGGLLAPRIGRRLMLAPGAAFILEGVFQAITPQAPWLWLAALFIATATMGAGVGNAAVSALLMRATPEHTLGRIYALMGTLSASVFALSMLAGGVLLGVASAPLLGACAGGLIALAGVAGAVLLWRGQASG